MKRMYCAICLASVARIHPAVNGNVNIGYTVLNTERNETHNGPLSYSATSFRAIEMDMGESFVVYDDNGMTYPMFAETVYDGMALCISHFAVVVDRRESGYMTEQTPMTTQYGPTGEVKESQRSSHDMRPYIAERFGEVEYRY